MIDLSEVSYGEILDCIVDASLGRLSPYFQEYARHEIASLANADGELPQAAVILQDVLEQLLKYSLQGTTQGNGLTGGVPPVRFSM